MQAASARPACARRFALRRQLHNRQRLVLRCWLPSGSCLCRSSHWANWAPPNLSQRPRNASSADPCLGPNARRAIELLQRAVSLSGSCCALLRSCARFDRCHHAFSMLCRCAKQHFAAFRALEPQMSVVFPRKTDAAVKLNGLQ